MNERIREVRKSLGLSQAKFASGISISSGYIAAIELGTRPVNARIIKLICSAFGVSEKWLRDGDGNMFSAAREDKLERLLSIFTRLTPPFQDYLLQQLDKLVELQELSDDDTPRG